MTEIFALGRFLTDWHHTIRHDLTASECETLPLHTLLAMASPADQARWDTLTLNYADHRGAHYLRAAIAAAHDGITPDQVLCCAGAQEAITCIARALLTRDTHAIVVLPIYQPSEHAVTDVGPATGIPLQTPTWRLDLSRLEAAIRPTTRLVLMNFPNSPTGATLDLASLHALIAICRRHNLWLVNDEVYRGTEPNPATRIPPVADLYERGISVNAVSKSFGLPGLRVGWLVTRDTTILPLILREKSQLSSSLAAPSEVLAHIAITAAPHIIARNRDIAAANRRLLDTALRATNLFDTSTPAQTVWAFPRYLGPGSADHFAADLARQAGVLVLPSSLWTSPLAATSVDHIRIGLGKNGFEEALEKILDFLLSQRECLSA